MRLRSLKTFLALSCFVAGTSTLPAGSIARLIYPGISSASSNVTQRTSVATLKSASIFPAAPGFREQLDDFSQNALGTYIFGLQARDNSGDDYGAWIRGFLEAPETGSYTFFIASDDNSELWLSTDYTEEKKQLIASETQSGAALFGPVRQAKRRSAPIPLTRGQKYFLEIFHKEAGGAAFLQVGWERPDGTREIVPARHLAQHPLDPFLARNDANLVPTFNPSGNNGGDLPANVSVDEGTTLVLEVDVIAAQPTIFAWSRNGVPIPGANLSFLTLPFVSASENNATYSVKVSNAFGSVISQTTTLSVSPDVASPSVVSVDDRGNPNGVRVTFSERVSPASANKLSNYSLKSVGGAALPIQSATLLPDQKSVQLSGTFGFVVNGQYELQVDQIQDQALSPNSLAPSPTVTTFEYAGDKLGPVGIASDTIHPLTLTENRVARFEVVPAGAPPYTYQWTRNGSPVPGATNASLEFLANLANAGDYAVTVANEFSEITSASATLTVQTDLVPPKLVSVRGLAGGLNEVRLVFDELLDATSATDVSHYTLGLVPVLSASVSADGRGVTLRTGPLQRDQSYLLNVTNLKDRAGNGLNGSTAFITELNYVGEVLVDLPVRYWRFNEIDTNLVGSVTTGIDAQANAYGTIGGAPLQGAKGLVPNLPDDTALEFFGEAQNQSIVVLNGSDLNANAGPWAKKTIEFWFKATTVPAPGTTGLASTSGIFEEGAGSRNLSIYLRRDPANSEPDQASLVFSGLNNVTEGPGSAWGLSAYPVVEAEYPIVVGEAYHVVAVFDGDPTGTTGNQNGSLILYVNGVEVSRASGAGQIYNHTGDVQIGRGNTLVKEGNGNLGFFDGTIDEFSYYNSALSPERIAVHYAAGTVDPLPTADPLAAVRVDARGNPNQLLVAFNRPLSASGGTVANYTLKTSSGTAIPIQTATLLAGERIVQLSGSFNFQNGSNYVLSLANITDQDSGPLAPNSSQLPFLFGAPAGRSYDFASGQPSDLQVFGKAAVADGVLHLTDAVANQSGVARFAERRDIEQAHIRFKVRVGDASTPAGEGFSVNLGADIPAGTFGAEEEGYVPAAAPFNDRLVLSFDNVANNVSDPAPSIAVKWRGVVVATALLGTGGLPPLETGASWADVDIRLLRGGKLTLQYAGKTVFDRLPTGFESVANGQLAFAGRTSAGFETHWIDDLYVNFAENEIGPVGIAAESDLANRTVVENQDVAFAIVPTGVGPFGYQWYRNGVPIVNETRRVLRFAATKDSSGVYTAVVRNEFSQVTSPQAKLTVDTDVVPPAIEEIRALAGSLNEIRIRFTEPLDPVSGGNPASYTSGDLTLLGVSLSADGRTAILKTSPQVFQQRYAVQVIGVKDRSIRANSFSGEGAALSTISYPDEVIADRPARYWRFSETNGAFVASAAWILDNSVTALGTLSGGDGPTLGQPSLVPNTSLDSSLLFTAANTNRILVPNGSDLNVNVGPWLRKSIEFWFKANSVPQPGANGFESAAGLFEEGAGSRGLAAYLWRDPSEGDPNVASLVFNSWNNVNDGPGSPYGVPAFPAFTSYPIVVGETYHVVGVFEGATPNVGEGYVRLYVNGVEVSNFNGVGALYNHGGDIQIGLGNTLLHTATSTAVGNLAPFDGYLDEFSYYNDSLTAERVAAHYAAGLVFVGAPPRIDGIERSGNTLKITWTGGAKLQRATRVEGPYVDVLGATSPHSEALGAEGTAFFRLTQ